MNSQTDHFVEVLPFAGTRDTRWVSARWRLPNAAVFWFVVVIGNSVMAQVPVATENSNASGNPETAQANEADFRESVVRATEMLGASEFASRERAAEELMELGLKAVPVLRELETHHDPEVRLRAADLVQQLTEGDFQLRVDAFLSGKDVDFDGWEYFQARLGTSPNVRELFVELTKRYPMLVGALEGTSRDRASALEAVVDRVQTAMFIERRFPEPVDVIALLLPASDPDVPVSPAFETMVVTFLQREAGTKLRRSLHLAAPATALIGDWVERSSEKNRGQVIWLTMDWAIPEGYPLSLRTLSESKDPQLLALSMQAISKFGSVEDVKSVAKFLDDLRPLDENEFTIGEQPQTLVCDVAMATIAILHKVPLQELGWDGVEPHPVFSVSPTELGFPPSKPELRAKARKKVDELLTSPTPKS